MNSCPKCINYRFRKVIVMEEIEFDCPVCDDGKKHKAIVLNKIQSEKKKDRIIIEVKCLDCGRVGRIIKIGDLGIEMYEFPPPES